MQERWVGSVRRRLLLSRALWIPGLVIVVASLVYGVIVFNADEYSTPWLSLLPNPLAPLCCAVGEVALLSGMIVRRSVASVTSTSALLWASGWIGAAAAALFSMGFAFEDDRLAESYELGFSEWSIFADAGGALIGTIAGMVSLALVIAAFVLAPKRPGRRLGSSDRPAVAVRVGSEHWPARTVLTRVLWVGGVALTTVNASWPYYLLDESASPMTLDHSLDAAGRISMLVGFGAMFAALIVWGTERRWTVSRGLVFVAAWVALAAYATTFLAWFGYDSSGHSQFRGEITAVAADVALVTGVFAALLALAARRRTGSATT